MFKLTIEDDEGKTTVVPLGRDEMTIGRVEGNTIRLTERNVSRRHARLVRQNGALFIEDLGSFTGVRVNGTKIASPTPLREGDEVQIGDYRLALRGEKVAGASAVADRPTMPSMPAAMGPMATLGGSVAIPTRASVAAMSAQPSAQPAQPMPASNTQPMATREVPQPMATREAPQPLAAREAPQPLAAREAPQPIAPFPAAQPMAAAVPAPRRSAPAVAAVAGAAASADVAAVPSAVSGAPGARAAEAVAAESAAPEVSEAQPTIPIRTLGERVSAGPAARVFALTTDLAGMEFALDRPSLVIGRTDENDLVLNHRSISRHHAKIVRDGEHYTIVDLQSANGVRVNGEDYERIELNPGDVIELGHVKLRFVGPNESFAFDAGAAGLRWRPSPKMIAAATAAVVVVVAGLAVALRRGSHRQEGTGTETAIAAAPPAPALVTPPPPAPAEPVAAPPAEPAVAAPPATPAAIMADAKQAAGSEDWDKARAALDRLGTAIADPVMRRDAAGLRRRIDTERQAAIVFAQFDEASSAKNYTEALARYQEIPADSIYKKRARPRYDDARTLVVAEHLASAEKARAAGRCGDVRTETDEVLRLEPRNLLARDMVRLCRSRAAEPAPVAVRPPRARPSAALLAENRAETARHNEAPRVEARHSEPARAEPPVVREAAPAAEAAEAPDPDALMKQAREAWLRQQCGSAIDLSRKALHAKPGMTDAYQIIAVCSCTLKDGEAAGRAYAKLDDKNRNLVHTLCQKNGINVGE